MFTYQLRPNLIWFDFISFLFFWGDYNLHMYREIKVLTSRFFSWTPFLTHYCWGGWLAGWLIEWMGAPRLFGSGPRLERFEKCFSIVFFDLYFWDARWNPPSGVPTGAHLCGLKRNLVLSPEQDLQAFTQAASTRFWFFDREGGSDSKGGGPTTPKSFTGSKVEGRKTAPRL